MKKSISIKLDERLWAYIKDKPNKSQYFERLVEQDIHLFQKGGLAQTIKTELLEDDDFALTIANHVKSILNSITDPLPNGITQEKIVADAPSPVYEVYANEHPTTIIENLIEDYDHPKPAASYKGEQPCCDRKTPCKHWMWDETELRYRNVLSNRLKVAE